MTRSPVGRRRFFKMLGGLAAALAVPLPKEKPRWSFGVAMDDWRALLRTERIELRPLVATTPAELFELMRRAEEVLRSCNGRPPRFSVDPFIRRRLRR